MKTLTFIFGALMAFISPQLMAANFTVDIAADDASAHDVTPGDGVCADALGSCTLRAAIEEANATAAVDAILFADGFVNARLVLDPAEGPLPAITTQMHFLGYTIDAYNSSAALLRDAPPQFTIDGSQLSSGFGLIFSSAAASDSEVTALAFVNFPNDGIAMAFGANNISINRSFIGINPDGTAGGNTGHGIYAESTGSHNIGKARHSNGTQFVGLGNVISRNGKSGIKLSGSSSNTIHGNIIGMAPTGTSDRGNGFYGIDISGSNNQIGDFIGTSKAGNFIAGNDFGGINLSGNNNRIYANSLGRGETGGFINSEGHGIAVSGDLNFIGNNGLAANEVYQHEGSAINLGVSGGSTANSNFIINNSIGSSGSFTPLLRSGNGDGIVVKNGNTNLIQNNRVINSGSESTNGYGIYVNGNQHTIAGNQVGFVNTLFGPSPEPNQGTAVIVIGDGTVIGTLANPNTVGGNDFFAVYAQGSNINVSYNYIGLTASSEAIGNFGIGLSVLHNSGSLTIENNYIGNNSSGMFLQYAVNTTSIRYNRIGVAPNGSAMGNVFWGIYVIDGQNIDLSYSTIANNGRDGIAVVSANNNDSQGVAIFQNKMYNNGGLAIDLGDDGITINDVGDVDEGNNRLQNTPVIESIVFDELASPNTLTISYRVDSNSGVSAYPFNIDFYWSGLDLFSQGRNFLGTDINYSMPNALKTVTFDFNSSANGGLVTATALDQDRNTSEMSEQFLFGEIDLIFRNGFE